MREPGKVVLWAAAGSAIAVASAWLLTSGSGQAKLSAHIGAAMSSGGTLPLPGQEPPVRTGVTVAAWQPYQHGLDGRHRGRRHPATASPNLTALRDRGYDWIFCPPSEGDL